VLVRRRSGCPGLHSLSLLRNHCPWRIASVPKSAGAASISREQGNTAVECSRTSGVTLSDAQKPSAAAQANFAFSLKSMTFTSANAIVPSDVSADPDLTRLRSTHSNLALVGFRRPCMQARCIRTSAWTATSESVGDRRMCRAGHGDQNPRKLSLRRKYDEQLERRAL
jgi:hypothetical protein